MVSALPLIVLVLELVLVLDIRIRKKAELEVPPFSGHGLGRKIEDEDDWKGVANTGVRVSLAV